MRTAAASLHHLRPPRGRRRAAPLRARPEPLAFDTTPFGSLSFKVKDAIAEERVKRTTVPSDKEDNASPAIIQARQKFAEA